MEFDWNLKLTLTDVVQTLGIIAATLTSAWQMYLQNRQAKASADLALMLKFDDITRYYLEHPGLWDTLDIPYGSPDLGQHRDRVENVVYLVLNTIELAHQHYGKYKLIDQTNWASWAKTLNTYARKPYFRGWWAGRRLEYAESFRTLVDARLGISI